MTLQQATKERINESIMLTTSRQSSFRPMPPAAATPSSEMMMSEVFSERYNRQQRLVKKKKTKKKTKRRRRRATKNGEVTAAVAARHFTSYSSSSEEPFHNQLEKMREKHLQQHQGFRPIAPPMPPIDSDCVFSDLEMDSTPQVLLWNNSRSRSCSSSSNSSSDGEDDDEAGEEHRTSPPDFFRTDGVARQSPSPPNGERIDSANVKANQRKEQEEHQPWELGPIGPKWYEWRYWQQKLSRDCCLPKHSAKPIAKTESGQNVRYQRKRRLEYRRPAYLQASPHPGLPYHPFVQAVPVHQLSPLTDATMYGYHPRPHQQLHQQPYPPGPWQHNTPYYMPHLGQQHVVPISNKGDAKPHTLQHNQNHDMHSLIVAGRQANGNYNDGQETEEPAKPKRGHVRTSSSFSGGNITPPPVNINNNHSETRTNMDDSPIPDYQSVSSLEPGSPWRTPSQQDTSHMKVIIPDTQPTMVTQTSTVMSFRVNGIRRRANTGDSPRAGPTNSASKPPVVPRRRTQSASGQKTAPPAASSNNTNASLPRKTSPNNANSVSRPRNLSRCFSEASANTNGSRHRRGGTVTEFSFESITNNEAFQNNIPKPLGTPRSVSLPMEVKVHNRPPRTTQQQYQHQLELDGGYDSEDYQRCPIVISVSPRHNAASPQSSLGQDETPDGYISPLEDEDHPAYNQGLATPGSSVIDRRSPTEDTVDFVTGSPQSNEQSNPQDSLKENSKEKYPVEVEAECNSPFGKLKEPPAITSGDSWMWKWVNNNQGLPVVQEDGNAVTQNKPTKLVSIDDESVIKKDRSPTSSSQKQQQEYLPKNSSFEEQWWSQHGGLSEGTALSGWVAFSLGDVMVQKLRLQNKPLDKADIRYLMARSDSQTLWTAQSDGQFEAANLKGCRCEVREISRRHGRAVVVTRNSTGEAVCTLLPISLPNDYSGTDDEFDAVRPFPKGDYLPDDQQYSTMHIMFSLDAVVKANGSWG